MNHLPRIMFHLFAFLLITPALASEQGGQSSSSASTPQQQFTANKQRLLDRIDSGDSKLQGAGLRDCIAAAQTPQDIHDNCRPQPQSNNN